jgi:general secretion pathway protein I
MFSKTALPIETAHIGRKGRSAGFTLLEVVVAAAITGLALVGLFQAGTSGVFAVDGAARVDEAIERAQSHLAAFGRSGAVAPGEIEGDDGGGYHWRLRSRPIATQQAAAPDQIASAMTLFAVDVEISWRAWGRNRSIVLDTRRLGSGAPAE